MEKSELYWTSLYLFLGFTLFILYYLWGWGWAGNIIIFRGLRLLKILNRPMVLDSTFTQRKSPPLIAFQIFEDFLHSYTQLCCSLSASRKPFLSNWERTGDSPKTYNPICICLTRCPDPRTRRQLYPWVGAHTAPTESVTTPLLHGWSLNIRPPVPISLTSPVWIISLPPYTSPGQPGSPISHSRTVEWGWSWELVPSAW